MNPINSNQIVIDSKFKEVGKINGEGFTTDVVKNEPMLFNCDFDHAYKLGGDITKTVLSALPEDWYGVPLVVDSRVHMLMKGWYPCIPGWHHDDVPRTRGDGQPDYLNPERDRSEHILCLINGDIAPTAFATGKAILTVPQEGVIYKEWSRDVTRAIEHGYLQKHYAASNTLIQFNDDTWHTGSAAVKGGWRFFIRVSRYFDYKGNPIARRNERTNEIRRQVQVYMDNLTEGW